jgi:subtilisin family serine protease
MDPALASLIEAGDPDDEVAVLIRWHPDWAGPPPGVRIVSTFGDIATVRVARGALSELRADRSVRSVKATTLFRADVEEPAEPATAPPVDQHPPRRPDGLALTGRGVVVGVTDWGLDFTHPTFRHPDGSTRVLALWNQQPGPDPAHPNKYGYGRIYSQSEIDRALQQHDPASALGYFAFLSDTGAGAHGTATTSIAAGSGWPGGAEGVAPDVDIVFVHLSTWGPSGPQGLGDSVSLAEAFDFIRDAAGPRACVINCSLGGTCGPHDGSNLLEQVLDAFVLERPGRMVAQSCGNYFQYDTHAGGELLAGQEVRLAFDIRAGTTHTHQVDIWYSGADRLTIGLIAPGGYPRAVVRPGQHATLDHDGQTVAEIRHRIDDPNDGRNEALIEIRPPAPAGTWQLVLQAADVVDGRFHAWIEREPVRPHHQTRFAGDAAVATTTTGTICNGFRPLAIGAYDARTPDRALSSFSSSGPTVDGRHKPDLVAPGSGVPVARSRPQHAQPGEDVPYGTTMSGTSMAAPHVTGAVACLLQKELLQASAIRSAILESCEPFLGDEPGRAGSGYLRIDAAAERLTGTARTGNSPAPAGTGPGGQSGNDAADPGLAAGVHGGQNGADLTHQPLRWAAFGSSSGRYLSGAGAAESTAVDILEETPPASSQSTDTTAADTAAPAVPDTAESLKSEAEFDTKAAAVRAAGFDPGLAIGPVEAAGSGEFRRYEHALITSHPTAGMHEVHGLIMQRYLRMGGPQGYLGYPTTDETAAGTGRFSRFEFQGSAITWHPVFGVHEIHGRIGETYFSQGGPGGTWGYPVTDEYPDGKDGKSSDVEGGTLAWTPANDVLAILADISGTVIPAAGDWPNVGRSARMGYAVQQLVWRYGFPLNGASGVVGNLSAESGVIPSRIEGSSESSPTRARNFAGVMTDFTPQQIMTRTRPDGPRLPGVGLAQWTAKARRAGLFTHVYNGRSYGADTLRSMDAQLDYLVAELQASFPGLFATLNNPDVSVDQASDDVVYNFEVPQAILLTSSSKRPRSDPAVQRVFRERRALSEQARKAFASTN